LACIRVELIAVAGFDSTGFNAHHKRDDMVIGELVFRHIIAL
jgi:hypothetical protein